MTVRDASTSVLSSPLRQQESRQEAGYGDQAGVIMGLGKRFRHHGVDNHCEDRAGRQRLDERDAGSVVEGERMAANACGNGETSTIAPQSLNTDPTP